MCTTTNPDNFLNMEYAKNLYYFNIRKISSINFYRMYIA